MATRQSFLGVDLGTAGIKVVELANEHKRPKLVTYGFSENKISGLASDFTNATLAAANILQEICSQAKTTSRQVVASLPSFEVHSSIITLPKLDKKELQEAVANEAKKLIPLPPEEVIIDWKVVEDNVYESQSISAKARAGVIEVSDKVFKKILTRQQPYVKILLTGTTKKLVESFLAIFKAAKLNLLSLETEDFALTRSLVGNDKSTIMLIDLGAATSTIILVEKGLPLFHRSLQHGGMVVSKLMAQKLNLNSEQSEQFKKDLMVLPAAQTLLPALQVAINPIINEIKYTHNLYQQQQPGRKIEKIILTGGTALLPQLPQFLANVLKTKVYLGDPWARVIYPEELKPLLDDLGSRFGIAVGLAMREIV